MHMESKFYRADTKSWALERILYMIAGCVNLLGLVLGFTFHPAFFIISFLVSINLVIFSLTGYCIMAGLLHHFGILSLTEIQRMKREAQ